MIDPMVTSKIKKTRNIRPKGVEQPKRVSRRGAKDVKSLLKTGESGGNQRP